MKKFNVIVLAGDRSANDSMVQTAGIPCKAFLPVNGRAMILRVLDALESARNVSSCIVCGPEKALLPLEPELDHLIKSGKVRWIENKATPSASVYHALNLFRDELPMLVTTADHALLTPEITDYFCHEALQSGCDVVAGLVKHSLVVDRFPETSRTVIKLKDGNFCSCNLFAFLTPHACEAASFWRACEEKRKKPWQQIKVMGWINVLLYITRLMSLHQALQRLSSVMEVRADVVLLPFPEAAIDVDKISDWRLVEKIIVDREDNKDMSAL